MAYEPSTGSQVHGSLDAPRFSTYARPPRSRRRKAPVTTRPIGTPAPISPTVKLFRL